MTKDKFIEIIEFIEQKENEQNDFCSILEKLSPGEYVNAFIYADYSTKLLDLLIESLSLNDVKREILLEWIWDFNFGKTLPSNFLIDDKEKVIDLSSLSKLYDYLISD